MALGDLVELTERWPEERIAEADRALLEAGLPSLSEIQTRFSKNLRRVVRRGRINSESEYYMVRNAADLGGDNQACLISLLAAYERA